ncbi:MAG: molybdopterin cofactor-binding domain-containing protein [Pseudomonadota bacterium]
MSRAGHIARRSFVIGSGAVVGGLALGFYAYRRDPQNPLLAGLAEGESALTPYLRIDADGVTVIAPRADVGQGAGSILAALVAEELDLDWQTIRVEHGPPSAAYHNGKVAAEGFPLAAIDDSALAKAGRDAAEIAGKLLGLQITGGSSTVPDAYDKMRLAGATAREMLKSAAAAEHRVALGHLATRDGAVILPDDTRIPYPRLAEAAALLDPPGELALRPPSTWRLLGTRMERLDIRAKSTGAPIYGIDLRLPGMLHATVRTNPRRGGTASFDASAAQTMPGVRKIVAVEGGAGVIADNTWRAFKAAEAIRFNWGPAPYPASTEEMFAEVEASFSPDRRDSRLRDDGDIEGALVAGTDVEATYRIPHLAHAPLEPMNATAWLRDGRLDLWTSTQIPRFTRQAAARMAGLGAEQVHLHVLPGGGSFGRRLDDDYVRQAVAVAQAMPGTPIQMVWSREEDMTHDFPRPLAIGRGRGRVEDGKVVAFDLDIATPSVAASQIARLGLPVAGPDVAIVAGAWDQPYTLPDYRVTGYRAPEMAPVSSWRSVGASVNGFLHESLLDELIHAAGADPLEERLRLCAHPLSRRVLEAVGEMASWAGPLGNGRGRGVALTLSFGVPVAEIVEVSATPDGIRLEEVFVAAEVGRVLDPVNFENQVQGGVIWGLGHAMLGEMTYADGAPEQTNFDSYEALRLYQTPRIAVRGLENGDEIRGIGEPPVPPAAPALANAIFAATGERPRELPLSRTVNFV